MNEKEFKHYKKMNKLLNEIENLEDAAGVISNDYRTKSEAFTGVQSRRDEIERLNNVIGGSESAEAFKNIDKEFGRVEKDLAKDYDKFQDLNKKIALKALEYEELYQESLDLLIQDKLNESEVYAKELLELRKKEVQLKRERESIQSNCQELIAAYNDKFGRFAYDMDLGNLRLAGFKPGSIYGKYVVN